MQLPMSAAQSRFWRHELLHERAGANNSLATLSLAGRLDIGRFVAALRSLVTRHEILRTRFEEQDGKAVQVIERAAAARVSIVDLSGVAALDGLVEGLRRSTLSRPFNLAEPPLFECLLLRTAPDRHVLLFVIHHIISDDRAQQLLIEEWVTTYLAGRPPDPLEVVPQYSQFVADELQYLSSRRYVQDRDWWTRYLAKGVPTQLSSATTQAPGRVGSKHFFTVDQATTSELVGIGGRHRTSLANVLLAGLLQTLYERTRQKDFLIGLMSGLRSGRGYERMLGCMVNILYLRASLGAQTVGELICSVRDNYLDVADHSRFPFEQAMSILPSRMGVPVEVVYVAQPSRRSALRVPDLRVQAVETLEHVPAFPLVVMSTQDEQGVSFSLEYDAALFQGSEIRAFAEHLQWTLACFVSGEYADTTEIGRAFTESQLKGFPTGSPRSPVWPARTLHGLFEWSVSRHPDDIAIIGPRASITYAGLDAWANQIARQLIWSGRTLPGDVIALACHRSIALVAGWIAILKAGGIALVVDLNESELETRRRLQHAGACRVLTDVSSESHAAPFADVVPVMTFTDHEPGESPTLEVGASARDQAIAYVCFTSGSTGTPGAVLGMHAATVNRLMWLQEVCPIRSNERHLMRTSPAFVDSIAELFGPLCAGATVILCPEGAAHDPENLVALIRLHRVNRVTLVPTLLRNLLPALAAMGAAWSEPCTWHVSGEALPVELARAFELVRPNDVLLNLYGSAEVAADVTASVVSGQDEEGVHVGRAISNCSVQVLDTALLLVPPYVEGDIYVGGAALSAGYLSDAARTAERFVPAPDGVGERLYRTGDRGYWLRDGNLVVAGRRDRQIKRHGVRIALDGIERCLESLSLVEAAAVFRCRDSHAVVALIVLRSPPDVPWTRIDHEAGDPLGLARLAVAEEQQLWTGIVAGLPATALPDRAFVVKRLPRTAGGKIRYELLERIPWLSIRTRDSERAAGAASETERSLIEICERILRKSGVRTSDRFLEMGMTSLQLVQLLHAIAETFSIRLKLSQLYSATSLRKCAELIDAEVDSVASLLQELV